MFLFGTLPYSIAQQYKLVQFTVDMSRGFFCLFSVGGCIIRYFTQGKKKMKESIYHCVCVFICLVDAWLVGGAVSLKFCHAFGWSSFGWSRAFCIYVPSLQQQGKLVLLPSLLFCAKT